MPLDAVSRDRLQNHLMELSKLLLDASHPLLLRGESPAAEMCLGLSATIRTIVTYTTQRNDIALDLETLLDVANFISPLHRNSVVDSLIWGSFRKHCMHSAAESLTCVTNHLRQIQELKD